MDLLTIAGFLGSGKTTLLLSLAEFLTQKEGKRVAILENEIGKVGVDDGVIAATSLPVREIYSGCICCSLRLDLIATLLELEREYAPDLVILEPSGVASPRQVLDALQGYGGEIDHRLTWVLMDPKRFSRIADLSLPLITDGLDVADHILLTKSDLVTDSDLEELEKRIHTHGGQAPVIPLSIVTGRGMDVLYSLLKDLLASTEPSTPQNAAREDDSTPQNSVPPGAVVVSRCAEIFAPDHDRLSRIPEILSRSLEALAKELSAGGCRLIGHIKATVKAPGAGLVMASITDFDQQATLKGRLLKNEKNLQLVVNVIVFGIDKATAEEAVDNHVISPLAGSR